ncbi:helix-turn-helix domain-containing protein [Roseomonas populi]|uniref:Helix-turn-helix transcriptional regulator n=1 Tax=Roseomonas populi TaxID=3121582 RepID=A0ABT1WZP6_9PROT|nr:helix-turn-helix transcriptional regulator [Roseomonas pecuniae]MCR0980598.1 helix-turn-helix transcriptional regulator [Roseomonas pecuniae]
MTPELCREARKLLGWNEVDLAMAAACSSQTVRNLEVERHRPSRGTLVALRAALKAAGVEFIQENGGDVGVRLRALVGKVPG